MKDKNMSPDKRGPEMLPYNCKHLDSFENGEHNGVEEMQLDELLLDRGNVAIAMIYWNTSSCSEKNDNLDSLRNKNLTRFIVFGDINYRDIDWQSNTTRHDEDNGEQNFLAAVKIFYLD